jgi:hypothetical protein
MSNINQLIILTPAEAAEFINNSILQGFERLKDSLKVQQDKANDVKFYTVAEFARIKKVHQNTVRSWIDNKQIIAEQKGEGCKILIPISQAEIQL